MSTNYYNTLQISKDASTNDIRKAYRRLALKWHPDKNPEKQDIATTKFKQISEAYEILSDGNKRKSYDLKHDFKDFDSSSTQIYRPFEFNIFVFRDPKDVFQEFFGNNDPFEETIDPLELLGGLQLLESISQNSSKCLNDLNDLSIVSKYGKSAPRRNCHCPNCDSTRENVYGCVPALPASNNPRPIKMPPNYLSASSRQFGNNMGNYDSSVSSGNVSICRNSTSIRFENGKKLKIQRTFENGAEIVKVYENDVLKSHTVNGQVQLN